MDLSALIFVALAVAWAVYLVPKALKYHEEDSANRSVDGFSDRLRVLARREAVSASEAELVPAGRRPSTVTVEASVEEPAAPAEPEVAYDEEPAAPTPAPRAPRPALARRLAARRAAERRRRVFSVLLLLNVVVAGLGIGKVIALAWVAAPVALLVAWLVACRLMVRRERAARAAATRRRRRTLADEALAEEDAETDQRADEPAEVIEVAGEFDADDNTDEIPAVTAALLEEEPVVDGWTPVPVPLPTYVAKAPAGRTVRTIDLDSTGVWSSGRNEADSQLAREADAQRAQADADAAADERRASGS